jgi:Holliday junction resolvase RusA-like endonuclease
MEGDNVKTEFFMPIIPPTVTHQETKVNIKGVKPRFYKPDELKTAEAKLQAHLGKHVPSEKYIGPVQVVVKWLFPITGKHTNGEWKTTKPDTHNMNKLLFDVMTELGFWEDDRLVCSEIIQKFWADKPGIYICIEDLR